MTRLRLRSLDRGAAPATTPSDLLGGRRGVHPALAATLATLQAITVVVHNTSGRLSSDDVWIQMWWQRWRPFGNEIDLSSNTWILHAPLSTLSEAVFGRRLLALAVTAAILGVIGLLLTLRFTAFLAGRLGADRRTTHLAVAVVGLWTIFASGDFGTFVSKVNIRNVELGLVLFAIQTLVERAEDDDLTATRVLPVAGLIGVLAYNDPWVLYAGAAPALAIIGLRWALRRATASELRLAILLLAGTAAYGVIRIGFRLAGLGFNDYASPGFAGFDRLPDRLRRGGDHILTLFGADLGDHPAWSVDTAVHLLRLATVVVAAVAVWSSRRHVARAARPAVAGLGIVAGAGTAAFVLSDVAIAAVRYLVPVVAALIALATVGVVCAGARLRAAVVGLVVLSVASVMVSTARLGTERVRDGSATSSLSDARTVRDLLLTDGLDPATDKVYADFWGGMALDWWADGSIDVAVVECGPDGFRRSPISPVDDLEPPSPVSYLVYRTSEGVPGCDTAAIERVLGSPTDEFVTPIYTVLEFDSTE